MTTLLKDMPEHMERIEGNYSLKQDIVNVIAMYGDIDDDAELIADELLPIITEFVNQNYEWKGVKS